MAEQVTGQRVELVWNRGIAARCDWRIPDEFPEGNKFAPVPVLAGTLWSSRLPGNLIANPSAYGAIKEGDLVWVRLSWLRSFVRQVLPLLKANFVLITGGSASCVPSELGSEGRELLGRSNLVHWYAENYDASMPEERISPLPLGIDFHTISEKDYWGEKKATPTEQEQMLLLIGNGLPPLQARHKKVYIDFGWQRGFGLHRRFFHPLKGTWYHGSRRQVVNHLRKNKCVQIQTAPLSRSEMWRVRGQYAFVVSPHGWGLDCHRTWEALALGHIVIVPSSSLDGLYSELPVVPVRRWDEINPENLERWFTMHSGGGTIHERLRSNYWLNKMRESVNGRVASGLLSSAH